MRNLNDLNINYPIWYGILSSIPYHPFWDNTSTRLFIFLPFVSSAHFIVFPSICKAPLIPPFTDYEWVTDMKDLQSKSMRINGKRYFNENIALSKSSCRKFQLNDSLFVVPFSIAAAPQSDCLQALLGWQIFILFFHSTYLFFLLLLCTFISPSILIPAQFRRLLCHCGDRRIRKLSSN